jgi:general secretion pathway protein D
MRLFSRAARHVTTAAVACTVAAGLAGCAGYRAFSEGERDIAAGRLDSGVAKLRRATEQSPDNNEYRRRYLTERETALNTLLRQAELAIEAGSFDAARLAFAQALAIDPTNPRAVSGTNRVEAAQRHGAALDASVALARNGDVDGALSRAQQVLSENPNHVRAGQLQRQFLRQQADKTGKELGIYPKLKEAYRKPVSLSFTGATLQQVFDALKQASGLNYMLDKDVRTDQRVTFAVSNKPVEDILRLLLATNQLERRVLDEDTLLIYPNTPAKANEYREMVVRTFYLSNADVNKVAQTVRTIAKARDVVVDDKLNLLIVRDSAEVVRLAEKLVAAQDVVEPEVMLELEVLEVSVSRLLEMGISWPSSVLATIAGAAGKPGQLTLDEFRNRNSALVTLNISDPALAARLRSQKGDANLLANPRVRVRNKQSAKVLIGERVPVFTTTATANVGTSESVNYLDVGLKLEIEPTVAVDNEVAMKMALEVSNILETITRTSGTQAYRLGTRNTSTTLRVRDGETNILAGLIQRDERRSNTGVPGFNELPLVSKLFGSAQDSDTRTEIVLLVTPRIVRNVEPPGVGLQEFTAGTESAVGAAPIQLGAPAAARPGAPVSAPQVPKAPAAVAPGPAPSMPASPATPQQPPALTPPPLVPAAPGAVVPTPVAPAAPASVPR